MNSLTVPGDEGSIEAINNCIRELDNEQLVLLSAKLAMPSSSLLSLAKDIYPNHTEGSLKQLIYAKPFSKVLELINNSPNLSGALMSIKLLPLAVLTLNKLMVNESTRANVRVTAAKELISLGKSSFAELLRRVDDKGNASDNVRKLMSG